jgi:hypothetical protein
MIGIGVATGAVPSDTLRDAGAVLCFESLVELQRDLVRRGKLAA